MISNAVPFAVDTLPECLEKEPNDSPAAAQRVTLPVIINGRIDRPGDWDVFRFEGRAGPADRGRSLSPAGWIRRSIPCCELTDAAGRQLAFNDDLRTRATGLKRTTPIRGSRPRCRPTGGYYLYMGDAQQKGGPEYAYRLRIGAPRPDFELRVAPSAINASAAVERPR